MSVAKTILKSVFSIGEDSSNKRIEKIDFLRGGAMVLVLLHHANVPKGNIILAFHMPLFFIISGYIAYIRGEDKRRFSEYTKNRFVRLIVPYFLFELLNLVLWLGNYKITGGGTEYSIIESIISIVTCVNNGYTGMYGRLWFLPCMFVADIYARIVLSYCSQSRMKVLTAILIFMGISWLIVNRTNIRLPFTVDTAFMAAAFILIGYLSGDFINDILQNNNFFVKIMLFAMFGLYTLYAIKIGNVQMLMYINEYGEYTFTILAAISGSFAFICIMSVVYEVMKKYNIPQNFIVWYDTNSLVTFPIHLTIKIFVLYHLKPLGRWYVLFVIMLFLNIPIVNIISRYFPIMAGKYKNK